MRIKTFYRANVTKEKKKVTEPVILVRPNADTIPDSEGEIPPRTDPNPHPVQSVPNSLYNDTP